MEMILISQNKLKIMISKADLERFDINVDMLDYNNTETKRMLWDILATAKRSVGFNPDGHRVFVQLFPSKSGDCELFVTKIGFSESSIYDVYEEGSEANDEEATPEDDRIISNIFKMYSLGALTEACRRLTERNLSLDGRVYILNDSYYFIILCSDNGFSYPLDDLSLISEYGALDTSEDLLFKIYEFGKLICDKDAIKIFSEL